MACAINAGLTAAAVMYSVEVDAGGEHVGIAASASRGEVTPRDAPQIPSD